MLIISPTSWISFSIMSKFEGINSFLTRVAFLDEQAQVVLLKVLYVVLEVVEIADLIGERAPEQAEVDGEQAQAEHDSLLPVPFVGAG
jgi:hypothetical protein